MGYIKFNDSPTIYRAKIKKLSEIAVEVIFYEAESVCQNGGFIYSLYDNCRNIIGDYSKYTNVVKKDNATIICSSKVIDVPEIEPERTLKDQVEDLEKENANLKEQLTDTQLALCEVYEMIGG